MAVELATAYVNLVASAKGISSSVARELAPVEAAAAVTGKRAGGQLAGGVAGTFGSKIATFAKSATLPLVGIGVAAFASAKGLEDAQNTILRTTGATGKAAERLETSFKRIATQTPASFGVIAETMSTLSQRTGLTGKSLEDLTLQVVTFNRISKDAPINVKELTGTLSAFNIPGAQMGKVLDRLFVTSQKTGVPLTELVSTLQRAGPTVRQFGFPIETAAGLLSTLNKAGVEAGPTVFALRSAFTKFAKAGKDPKVALQGVIGEIGKLVKAGDLAAARKLGVELFGARGVGLVDAAVNGKLSLDSLTRSFDSTGAGIRETASKTSTLSGKLGLLKNNAQLALAELGKPVVETLNSGLKSALPVLTKITSSFAKLPDPVQKTTIGLIAIGAAVTPVTKLAKGLKSMGTNVIDAGKGLGKAAAAVARFSKATALSAVSTLRSTAALVAEKVAAAAAAIATKVLAVAQGILNAVMDANPVVLIIAAIVALGVAIFIAYKKFKPFRNIVDAVGRALATTFDFVKRNWKLILGLLLAPFIVLPILIVKNFDKIKAFLGRIIPVIGRFGLNLLEAIVKGLAFGLPKLALFFLVTLPLKIIAILLGLTAKLIPVGVKILRGLLTGFFRVETAIAKFYLSLPGKIVRFIGNTSKTLFTKGVTLLKGLLLGFISFEIKIFNFYKNLPGRIVTAMGAVGKFLFNKGISLLRGLRDGANSFVHAVFSFFTGLPKRIVEKLGDVGTWLFDLGKNVMKGFLDGLKNGAVSVKDWFVDKGKEFVHDITHPWDALSPSRVTIALGKNIMDGLAVGLTKNVRQVDAAFAKVSALGPQGFNASGLNVPAAPAHIVGAVRGGDGRIADTIVINHVKDNDDAVRKLTWAAKTRGR